MVSTTPDANGGPTAELLAAPGHPITLDASVSSGVCLNGALQFRFSIDGGAALRGWSEDPELIDAPTSDRDYRVEVRCTTDLSCFDSAVGGRGRRLPQLRRSRGCVSRADPRGNEDTLLLGNPAELFPVYRRPRDGELLHRQRLVARRQGVRLRNDPGSGRRHLFRCAHYRRVLQRRGTVDLRAEQPRARYAKRVCRSVFLVRTPPRVGVH